MDGVDGAEAGVSAEAPPDGGVLEELLLEAPPAGGVLEELLAGAPPAGGALEGLLVEAPPAGASLKPSIPFWRAVMIPADRVSARDLTSGGTLEEMAAARPLAPVNWSWRFL